MGATFDWTFISIAICRQLFMVILDGVGGWVRYFFNRVQIILSFLFDKYGSNCKSPFKLKKGHLLLMYLGRVLNGSAAKLD